jgi:Spy/CpxP family protein refolding chaperone
MGMEMGMRGRGGHEMGLEWAINNPKLREQLLITPEQIAKIRQETLKFQKAEILSRADLQVKRLELHSLLDAETPDRAAIDKSLREANAAQFTVEKTAIDHQLAMRALVTPEQRQKLEKMRQEFPRHNVEFGGPGARGMTHPGEKVMFMRRDDGGMMHPGGNATFMHPGVEKTIIMRSGEATAVPAPPVPPPAPPQQ